MQVADLARLISLAAIWGGSYVLLRVVAPIFGGWDTAMLRVLIAGVALVTYAAIVRTDLKWRQWWRHYLFIGLFNSAIPFALIAYAMKTLPAGYGAILNALSPFFSVLAATAMLKESIAPMRVVGLALGFFGVAMLVNLGPVKVDAALLFAAGCCVVATLSYGFISVWIKRYASQAPQLGLAGGALVLSGTAMVPGSIAGGFPGIYTAPPIAWACLIALALVCSAIAYLLYFRLIKDIGPTKAISVTFLIPFFGVAWGAVFFGERLTIGAIAGGVVILLGMTLVLQIFPRPAALDVR